MNADPNDGRVESDAPPARDFIYRLSLDFTPGTRWAYSSSNYSLLGGIIEAVTEQHPDSLRGGRHSFSFGRP